MFYLEKNQNGKYLHTDSVTSNSEYLVEHITGKQYRVTSIKFNLELPFNMNSLFYFTIINNGKVTSEIDLFFNINNSQSRHLTYNSSNPLIISHHTDLVLAVCKLFDTISLFNSLEDFLVVADTINANHYNSEKLKEQIFSLSAILKKYGHSDSFFIRDYIISWLKNAMIRFSYDVQKFSQEIESDMKEPIHTLNSFGYQVTKK